MTYSPLYKQPKPTMMQAFAAQVRSNDFRDGLKLISGMVLCASAGWYGVPFVAMMF